MINSPFTPLLKNARLKWLPHIILNTCLIMATHINAQIELPAIFSDNMVLQQQTTAPIWGNGIPNSRVTVSASWLKEKVTTTTNEQGSWRILLNTPSAGGPHRITIKNGQTVTLNNVMIGEVWLCSGQSNMEMPMKGFPAQPVEGANNAILRSKNPNIRIITVKRASKTTPQSNFEGTWQMASPETVANFSATAYFFGQLLNDILDTPIGLISSSYGGSCIEAWMSNETATPFEQVPVPKPNDSILSPNRTPTVLYNGMIHPLIGYSIRGAIWYQGETNYRDAENYPSLMKSMVEEWRQKWNQGNFPFYYCQIAPYDYQLLTPSDTIHKHSSAYLREAQLEAAQIIPNSAMAVLLDAGEESNIHPAKKQIAAHRLAYLALAKTYGIKGFGAESPVVNEVSIKDSIVVVNFLNAPNGITSYGKTPVLFELAGDDKQFFPAKAVLGRKSITLQSTEISKPKYVRYAFKNFVEAEIFNTEGLPLSSFRTDE
jgi:sialate O-acetylesterase